MDEADFKSLDLLATALEKERIPEWIDIHNLRMVKYGPNPHIDCHVTLPFYKDLRFANEQIEKLNQIVNENLGIETEMFVLVDPCLPSQCSLCRVASCSYRTIKFEHAVYWNLENLLADRHHQIIE